MKSVNRQHLVKVIDACVDKHQCLDAEKIADAILEVYGPQQFTAVERGLIRQAVSTEQQALSRTRELAHDDNQQDTVDWVDVRLRQYHDIKKKLET